MPLRRLVTKSRVLYFHVKKNGGNGEEKSDASEDRSRRLYMRGRNDNYCTLVLDGVVNVIAGVEGFKSNISKWDMLAKGALTASKRNGYAPDFTATVAPDVACRVLRISQSDFASIVLRHPASPSSKPPKTTKFKTRSASKDKSTAVGIASSPDTKEMSTMPTSAAAVQPVEVMTLPKPADSIDAISHVTLTVGGNRNNATNPLHAPEEAE